MRNARVAKRYAQSLLDAALNAGALDQVMQSVELFHIALGASAPLRALLRNPVIAAERKKAVLDAIFGEQTHPLFRAFLQLVCTKGRENVLDQIAEQFITLYDQYVGIVRARVVSAVELPADIYPRIESLVATRFGGTPQIHYRIEPAILGGLIVECNDVRLDASLVGQLQRLREQLLFANGRHVTQPES
ncbi:MAG: ATP synthase F1 subunit delta [Chlorobi bacterium]|nr:ATP synthase F1 subunit delta [Chlorobiota bacterium]